MPVSGWRSPCCRGSDTWRGRGLWFRSYLMKAPRTLISLATSGAPKVLIFAQMMRGLPRRRPRRTWPLAYMIPFGKIRMGNVHTGLISYLHTQMSANLLIGYFVSIVVGAAVTYVWSKWMHIVNGSTAERFEVIPLTIGLFERAIITTLVIWIPASTGAFVGGWFMVKAVGGWAKLVSPSSKRDRATYFIGLLGGLMSVLMGNRNWLIGCTMVASTSVAA